ncbi:ABC transporter ATP-binding protein [Acetobacter conturbans]|uniref:ATP-binding cassette domain-containing protein n=1 Tax=Acetobacter conturbans TaxID=1737472 RepID=A0ABX0K1L7_9PROT|nr:ABC transporter ATP-binding protein [Acetobacter conturbans]NHN89627.1 ATP-binding cassette domain-containing protein [Acetobacter conturbans]
MLETRDVTFTTGGATLLHHASAGFESGTVTGLLGPNGAGKSTLLKLLAGLLPPTEGAVFCDGDDLTHLNQSRRARRIAYMPQDIPPFPPMPVREIASLGRLPYAEAPDVALNHPAVSMAMGLVGLDDLATRPASRLSGGERARLMLARALAVEAPVLLADEPVAALDPAHALSVMRVFRALAAEGRCVVLVIHDLMLATRFCDRLVVMKEGAIRYALPAEALSDAMVREVYGVDVRRVEGAVVPWG